MISRSSTLEDIKTRVKDTLSAGIQEKKNEFRYPVLGTIGHEGIQQRKVALRDVKWERNELRCYSDYRTGKVSDILQNSRTNWLFYHGKNKEQIRASGIAKVHHLDDEARKIWDSISPHERGDYLGQVAPGTVTKSYYPNLPPFFLEKKADYQNTEFGFQNFCVIACYLDAVEYLILKRNGHIRAKFLLRNGDWKGMWLDP